MPEPAVSPTGMYSARVQATPWGILKLTKALLMFPGCISRNLPSAPSSAGQTHTQAHARKHTDSPPPPPGAPTSGALKLQAPSARTPPGHSMPCLVGTACPALWAQHVLPCGHSMFCFVGTACPALWAQHVLPCGHSMFCFVGTACSASWAQHALPCGHSMPCPPHIHICLSISTISIKSQRNLVLSTSVCLNISTISINPQHDLVLSTSACLNISTISIGPQHNPHVSAAACPPQTSCTPCTKHSLQVHATSHRRMQGAPSS